MNKLESVTESPKDVERKAGGAVVGIVITLLLLLCTCSGLAYYYLKNRGSLCFGKNKKKSVELNDLSHLPDMSIRQLSHPGLGDETAQPDLAHMSAMNMGGPHYEGHDQSSSAPDRTAQIPDQSSIEPDKTAPIPDKEEDAPDNRE